jgi:hypothetical protein
MRFAPGGKALPLVSVKRLARLHSFNGSNRANVR